MFYASLLQCSEGTCNAPRTSAVSKFALPLVFTLDDVREHRVGPGYVCRYRGSHLFNMFLRLDFGETLSLEVKSGRFAAIDLSGRRTMA
jgi:hypothetical protein